MESHFEFHERLVKKPFSKAARSEVPEAYPQRYVEGTSRLRTPLKGFFTSLRRGV
jgi:hypothetical protein